MPIKKFKAVTPTSRYKTVNDFSELSKKGPEKSLIKPLKRTGGRNSQGTITSRRRGGGHKKRYRIIDFTRRKVDISAKVVSLEYDPNRSANIALIQYADGEKAYIIAPLKLKVGDKIISGSNNVPINVGNAMPLKNIPIGTNIYNLEIKEGKGGQIARSAGSYCTVVAKENNMVHVKLPSNEIRLFHNTCFAVIGQVGNIEHENVVIGSAGRNRHLGKRPKVRGVAMNPVDHPMGGGEGKTSGGGHPVSPWGKKAKGKKTRKNKKPSQKLIVKSRKG